MGRVAAILGGSTDLTVFGIAERFLGNGPPALRDLRGSFALALWDGARERLHLLRDPAGARPLFFAQINGLIAFASLPSGLFPLTGGEPDLEGLAQQRAGPLDGNRTPFRSIHRVLPGEHVVLDLAGTVARDFPWMPPVDPDPRAAPDVDRVRGLLDRAVGSAIPADGLVACHLSSGRDSGAVAATAARLSPGRVIAFTGAPSTGATLGRQKDRSGDESEAAAQLAAQLGIEHHVVRYDGGLFDPIAASVRGFQTMMHPLSNLGWMAAIDRAARDSGARTLLVGSMGNLTLNAGGLPALQDYLRQGRLLRWAREYRAATARPDVSWKGAAAASLQPWLPERLVNALFQRFGDYSFPDPDRFIRREFHRREEQRQTFYPGRRDWRGGFARTYMVADPGLRRLGLLGSYGLTEHDPLADRDLAEAMLSLPPEAFLKDGRYRPFADAVLADRLPAEFLAPRPRGLQSADWLDRFDPADALALIEECRTSTAVEQFLDLDSLALDIGAVKGLQTEGFGRQIGQGWHLMEALQIAVFLHQLDKHADRFGDAQPPV